MATESDAPGAVTKSGAKNAKSDAQKFYKKRPDPEGLKTGANASRTLLLSDPKTNLQAKPMRDGVPEEKNYARNSQQVLDEHLKTTGGKYLTRFPPEPNGYLHIGHAKAMNFNFGQAKIAKGMGIGGETIMRFDDTNPEAEKQEYIDSILANVKWLGNNPIKVTYSSDYFDELYQFALQLIRQGDAYVCHQTKDEIKASRDIIRQAHIDHLKEMPAGAYSPWRETGMEENLAKFEKMRTGQYEEGKAMLRMKGDLWSDNPAMWDTVFYRIKFSPHPKAGDRWCIYPTYDYTHCIVDSLENISHSLCTLEFETRQAADGPYYWLLHKLGIYKPVTWEYSRCNITHNVLSKRKLNALVTKKIVSGWDDPRLLTLDGLRRRGYSPSSINAFCEQIGVTRSGTITTQMHVLENCIRTELDLSARRVFAVVRPLKVEITNMTQEEKLKVPNHPKDPSMGEREILFSRTIFIERDDFRLQDDPQYFGLAPNKDVGLLGTGVVLTCTEVVKDSKGNVEKLKATVRPRGDAKPKGNIHWVSEGAAVKAELRLYSNLFTVENPNVTPAKSAAAAEEPVKGDEDVEDDEEVAGGAGSWLDYINQDSLKVEKDALVEPSLLAFASQPGTSFQFQRVGFFAVDLDSSSSKLVFNRVVPLTGPRAIV
ncbi:hypothetical protein GUITHDRAFT_163164 [Guillardia theta CCMP2712]|uniref:glutamine--tRNA ligase n=1 Tax=Guillardia theta (strain CCMP2712) TaxID=905079 RepID=L1JCQ8_GUITC|nr:hypothetical protein GUITHDRAFT_163164 [Guillardia theta CCMP2712]EKX45885.1 hypothetical protein GUITHDRAFT_163164 [Guillardia theta CCMP2712]|eukprot:XP_005832865.1 hypothetical protein GUITHDRAFT_163164 [Guillardia theta CCMP2712]